MFPLYDENQTRTTPLITYGLIGINILVFLHEVRLPNEQLEQFFQLYAIIPRELSVNPGVEWTTLFTSQFLHGGWWHLISNMVFLWVFGNNIEDRMGHLKYLIFYLCCGALAGLCQWLIGVTSPVPSLGASGSISGILGAYLIRFPQVNIMTVAFLGFFFTTLRIPAFVLIGLFIVQNVISGLAQFASQMSVDSGGVAYWAHIGGFVFGMILGPIFGLFRRGD